MSEIVQETKKRLAEQDAIRHKREVERALTSQDPDHAVYHLREGARNYDTLAEIESLPSPKRKYRDRATEFRRIADRIAERGITAVVRKDGEISVDAAEERTARSDISSSRNYRRAPNERTGEEIVDTPLVTVEWPTVTFSDVGGMDALKQLLLEKIAEPIRRRNLYRQYGLQPIKGVLLQGPPGTGKTYIIRALAGEISWSFIELSPADVTSALVGEGAKNVRESFELAKQHQPCILFFDEIDSIALTRSGTTHGTQSEGMMLTQLLTEMNDLDDVDVVVIGATNTPESVDRALLNARRFAEVIEVPLPDADARAAILRVHLRKRSVPAESIDFERIAEQTPGFSGADMEAIATDAARIAVKEAERTKRIVPITHAHIESAVQSRLRSRSDALKGGYLDRQSAIGDATESTEESR